MTKRKHPVGIIYYPKELKKGTVVYHPVPMDAHWKQWASPSKVGRFYIYKLTIRRLDGFYLEVTKGVYLALDRNPDGAPVMAPWEQTKQYLFTNYWYAVVWCLRQDV